MDIKTQKAVYKWFEKRGFICSFADFADKFEFADPAITFSGFVVYDDGNKEDLYFDNLNFHDLTKTSSNGNRPPISTMKGVFMVGLEVDGIDDPVLITVHR